ncbi:MAG: hypothetical protein E7292_12580 [Lachnospiraceae bacterium]|nr:hypothetical protein [Lachnospiraceae bacterium]
MVEYILGNYLVETGKITKDQLCEVIAKQDSVRVKLGLIAVSEGMMTTRQAEEVNLLQAVKDKRFGDIAIEEGYLNEEQVEKLLKKQGNAYLMFVQNLVDAELVAMEDVDWLLDDFKKVNNYSNSDLEDIKSDDVDRILPLLLPEEAQSYATAIGTVVRTIIRLVDRHAYIGRAAMVDSFPSEGVAIQKMEGTDGVVDCFAERNGALLKLCSIFGQEAFSRLDLDALDAAGELLNCANGMFVSELSRQGKFLELMPPEYAGVDNVSDVCRIPIFIGNLGLYYAIGKLK